MIHQLTTLEKTLLQEQLIVSKKTEYLMEKMKPYFPLLLIAVTAPILWGWKHGKLRFSGNNMKQLNQFVFYIVTLFLKRRLLLLSRK